MMGFLCHSCTLESLPSFSLEKVLVLMESMASLGCQNPDLFSCRHKYVFTSYSCRVWWDFHISWSHQNSVITAPNQRCVGKTWKWTANIHLCILSTHIHSLFTGLQRNTRLKIKACHISRWLQNIKLSRALWVLRKTSRVTRPWYRHYWSLSTALYRILHEVVSGWLIILVILIKGNSCL